MYIENLKPLGHYALENHPTIFDEEALTALELASRTAAKMNETIELLLKECKEQNLTIKQAVDFMKEHLDESAKELLYKMAEEGELDILLEENYQAIRKHITTTVNVKEYGAVGDGVTDDTQAIKEAIANGVSIFFPAGRYLVTEPLEIATYKHLHGEGCQQSVIVYEGSDFLLTVSTRYDGRACIEKIGFTGTANNKFLRCSCSSRWGASVLLRDFAVYLFSAEVMRFESAYASVVENGLIATYGPVVFTTFDGTATETNFNNANTFTNVYMRCFSEAWNPVHFDLFNCRDLTFDRCSLEKTDLLLRGRDKVKNTTFRHCWFEYITTMYDMDSTCDAPNAVGGNYVSVSSYNANNTGLDYLPGRNLILDKTGGNSMMQSIQDEKIILEAYSAMSNTDGYGNWLDIYYLGTKGARYNVPLNMTKVTANNVASATCSLSNIVRYSGVGATFRCKVYCRYASGDYRLYEFDIVKLGTTYIMPDNPALVRNATWTGSSGESSIETITCDGGNLSVSTTVSMTQCIILVETNIHPV